jgi:hypothetical protein
MYFLDRGDPAAIAQPHIDDHQIRPASRFGAHRIGLGGLDPTHVMAHSLEHLGEQHTDQGIVFHHEDSKSAHR